MCSLSTNHSLFFKVKFWACVPVCLGVWVNFCLCVCLPVWMYACMPMCIYVCLRKCLCACISVCLWECVPMYICACMLVYMCFPHRLEIMSSPDVQAIGIIISPRCVNWVLICYLWEQEHAWEIRLGLFCICQVCLVYMKEETGKDRRVEGGRERFRFEVSWYLKMCSLSSQFLFWHTRSLNFNDSF